MPSDFYSRRADDYSANYNLNGSAELWVPESKNLHSISGINEFFSMISPIIRNGSVRTAFDVGIGPAAREVFRYLHYGWDTCGCDVSEDVVQRARRELGLNHGESTYHIFSADLRKSKDFDAIKGRHFDLISCLNVIQHLEGESGISYLIDFLNEYTSKDGYVLILFKRSDYDSQEAQERGLIIKRSTGVNDLVTYYDATFKEFRNYSIFDTDFLVAELEKIGFKEINELQHYSIYRFYNTRNFPCTFLVMKRGK